MIIINQTFINFYHIYSYLLLRSIVVKRRTMFMKIVNFRQSLMGSGCFQKFHILGWIILAIN